VGKFAKKNAIDITIGHWQLRLNIHQEDQGVDLLNPRKNKDENEALSRLTRVYWGCFK